MVLRPKVAFTRAEFDAAVPSQLSSYFNWAYRQLNPGAPLIHNWHIHALAEALTKCVTGETKRLIITLPPRNLKSLCASVVFPSWVLGRDPTRKIINITYSEALTKDFARGSKALMESEDYKRFFPRTRINPRANADTDFTLLNHRGRRFGTTVFGPITGMGGNFIIIDDPIKPEDARSDTMRVRVNEWFESTALSRLDHKEADVIILIMQRLHVDDLAGRLLEAGGWEHVNLPAIAMEEQVIDLGQGLFKTRRVGEPLNPKFESLQTLQALRASMGDEFFQPQYQQAPVMPGGNIIKLEWLQRFQWPLTAKKHEEVVFSWDTAFNTGEANDWSVCTVWLVRDAKYYLVEVFRARLNGADLIENAARLYAKYPSDRRTILLEKVNGIELVARGIEEKVGQSPELVPPLTDKVSRLWSQTPVFQRGEVFVPDEAPWLNEYVKELTAFPRAKHDDQVDSTSQFLIWMATKPDRSVTQLSW